MVQPTCLFKPLLKTLTQWIHKLVSKSLCFVSQESPYPATQSFPGVSVSSLKTAKLLPSSVQRPAPEAQPDGSNPCEFCLHLFTTNSYNPCVISYGVLLPSWERAILCFNEKKPNKLFWFWSVQRRSDNPDTVSFSKSGRVLFVQRQDKLQGPGFQHSSA